MRITCVAKLVCLSMIQINPQKSTNSGIVSYLPHHEAVVSSKNRTTICRPSRVHGSYKLNMLLGVALPSSSCVMDSHQILTFLYPHLSKHIGFQKYTSGSLHSNLKWFILIQSSFVTFINAMVGPVLTH